MSASPSPAHPALTPIVPDEVAATVLATGAGRILMLCGLGPAALRQCLRSGAQGPRAALFLDLPPSPSAERLAEALLHGLAETARRMWPLWYAEDLGVVDGAALQREAARLRLGELEARHPALSRRWAEAAAGRAMAGATPRASGAAPALELAQLGLAIHPGGLVLVTSLDPALGSPAVAAAFIHLIEWAARTAGAAVVVLATEPPGDLRPWQRILYGARLVVPALPDSEPARAADGAWLAPVLGRPHPMSRIERELARRLARDAELRALFSFNQLVRTARGSIPRVDLLWADGRLVVELDGYSDHNTRRKFADDRHRDYELTMSGYTVLRIANDEIAQDFDKAIEKIRDVVRLRRAAPG